MSPLQQILTTYRAQSQTEREKGTYFEELIRTYFRNEPKYRDLYSDVWLFGDWAKAHGFTAKDTGIDLVAKTQGTEEYQAIPLHSFAVCSDAEVGKKRSKDDDIVETFAHELRYPATTDAKRLAFEMKRRHDAEQSIFALVNERTKSQTFNVPSISHEVERLRSKIIAPTHAA